MDDSADQDAFERGFHDVPSDAEMRALSDMDLYTLIASANTGSVRRMALETENERRKEAQKSNSSKPSRDHWYKKPVATISLTVLSALVVAAIVTAVRFKFPHVFR